MGMRYIEPWPKHEGCDFLAEINTECPKCGKLVPWPIIPEPPFWKMGKEQRDLTLLDGVIMLGIVIFMLWIA